MQLQEFEFKGESNIDEEELIEFYKSSGGEFAPLNRLATQICDTPVSLVNFLDENFQYTVSKAGDWDHDQVGPSMHSACQYTVQEKDNLLIINDTQEDERTGGIKELVEDKSIRFYAGMPIRSPGGKNLGALCVLDFKPRELNEDQKQALRDLAAEVEYRIKLYRKHKKLEQSNRILEKASAFLRNSTDILWEVNPKTYEIIESKGVEPTFEYPDSEIIGKTLFDFINEIDIQKHIQSWVENMDDERKLGIPVRVQPDSGITKWLTLTFTKYKDILLVTGRDVTKEHEAEEKLREALDEKKVLLAEIHHRVKNNLAVVSSLLQLERERIDNELAGQVLLNSESRIITIAKIHELLYESDNFSNVDLRAYIEDLVESLNKAYNIKEHGIEIDIQIANLSLNANQALPLGLITNEMITNAIKHAFPKNKPGIITIIAMEKNEGWVQFEVRDNGVGLDLKENGIDNSGNMGFTLISTLSKQLQAELDVESNHGTVFKLHFQKNDKKGSVTNLS